MFSGCSALQELNMAFTSETGKIVQTNSNMLNGLGKSLKRLKLTEPYNKVLSAIGLSDMPSEKTYPGIINGVYADGNVRESNPLDMANQAGDHDWRVVWQVTIDTDGAEPPIADQEVLH